MASTITAGNATNGLGISSDNTGILALKSGTGAGTTALTLDASQNATFAGNVSGVLKSGTAVASTSGTSIDFTGIPATAKRITVMFNGVSTSGTSIIQVQLGDAGGLETTGYVGNCSVLITTSTASFAHTTGIPVNTVSVAAANYNGFMVINLLGSNVWVANGTIGRSDIAANYVSSCSKSLSDTLDRIRITTVNGTDTFDAGSINILWE